MRTLITLVETAQLNEAAGTYGFFRPKTETEVLADETYQTEHADYVEQNPEQFGVTAEEIASCKTMDGKQFQSGHQSWMSNVLSLIFKNGWVRVNYYRGSWSFQGIDEKTTRAALQYYATNNYVGEAIIDWGPDASSPVESVSLYPEEAVQRYIKSRGKVVSSSSVF